MHTDEAFDDAPTQRVYCTAVGVIDWERASAAAQSIASGHIATGNYRCLSALFETALRARRVNTSHGLWDAASAERLLERLRKHLTVADLDCLWTLLYRLFDRPA